MDESEGLEEDITGDVERRPEHIISYPLHAVDEEDSETAEEAAEEASGEAAVVSVKGQQRSYSMRHCSMCISVPT